jgi:hypothetical protein
MMVKMIDACPAGAEAFPNSSSTSDQTRASSSIQRNIHTTAAWILYRCELGIAFLLWEDISRGHQVVEQEELCAVHWFCGVVRCIALHYKRNGPRAGPRLTMLSTFQHGAFAS